MLYTRLRPAIAIAIDFSEEICGAPDASFVVCVAYIGWLATWKLLGVYSLIHGRFFCAVTPPPRHIGSRPNGSALGPGVGGHRPQIAAGAPNLAVLWSHRGQLILKKTWVNLMPPDVRFWGYRPNAQNSISVGAPPQTPLEELTVLPQTPSCI